MAGVNSRADAEGAWNKYNTDEDEELTVDEVKQCLQEIYEENPTDDDVKTQYRLLFGQGEPKNMKKEEFINGVMKIGLRKGLEDTFKKLDKNGDGTLCYNELKEGLENCPGFKGEKAEIILDEIEYSAGDDKAYDIKEFLDIVSFADNFVQTYSC